MISNTSLLWEQLVQNWKTWAHPHFELKILCQNIPFCRDCMHLQFKFGWAYCSARTLLSWLAMPQWGNSITFSLESRIPGASNVFPWSVTFPAASACPHSKTRLVNNCITQQAILQSQKQCAINQKPKTVKTHHSQPWSQRYSCWWNLWSQYGGMKQRYREDLRQQKRKKRQAQGLPKLHDPVIEMAELF